MRYNSKGFQKQARGIAKRRGNQLHNKSVEFWQALRVENARRTAAAS